jgi:cell division septation protein DedD
VSAHLEWPSRQTPPVSPPWIRRQLFTHQLHLPLTRQARERLSAEEKLTYPDRLSATPPPPETLKEPARTDVKPAAAVKDAPPVAPPVRATSKSAASEPAAGGYVVQVAAVKVRSEADTIAKRLQSKGFPSFVTTPSAGAARVYRVRVGKYNDRREAESVARRLEKEEQFKPWITR